MEQQKYTRTVSFCQVDAGLAMTAQGHYSHQSDELPQLWPQVQGMETTDSKDLSVSNIAVFPAGPTARSAQG